MGSVTYWSTNVLHVPASALEIVGLETMTGVTPGAFVMASKWTNPMRPIPITPTLITSLVSTSLTVMDSDDERRANEGVGMVKAADDATSAEISRERSNMVVVEWYGMVPVVGESYLLAVRSWRNRAKI